MSSISKVRGVHLCGSLKLPESFKDSSSRDETAITEKVMRGVAEALPGRLLRITDGEVEQRENFVVWQAGVFAKSPWICEPIALQLAGVGVDTSTKSSSKDTQQEIELGDLGYDTYAIQNYQIFKKLKEEGILPNHTRFQVSLPTPLNSVAFLVAQEYKAQVDFLYEAALVKVVKVIQDRIPHADLAIQWDCALEFAFLERTTAYGDFKQLMVHYFEPSMDEVVSRVQRLSNAVEPDVQLGYHLCYGDLGHQHHTQPKDTRMLVDFCNTISAAMPVSRPINWFHMPVPIDRIDDEYFAPLKDLHMHPGTELYLGLVHAHDLSGTKKRIDAALKVVPEFGVATECGLGRTPISDIQSILDIQREVSSPF